MHLMSTPCVSHPGRHALMWVSRSTSLPVLPMHSNPLQQLSAKELQRWLAHVGSRMISAVSCRRCKWRWSEADIRMPL